MKHPLIYKTQQYLKGKEVWFLLFFISALLLIIFISVFDDIRTFFEAGGPVLWGILLVTIIMWTLIIERFWFFYYVLPSSIKNTTDEWNKMNPAIDWYSKKIRDQMISELSINSKRFILTIETMMQILPLLGLLGTVVGMIKVFDVMTFFGTGNARLMASGVSQATIPTMAGLVAAISGLYIANILKRKADDEIDKVADHLMME
ncbi:MAG: MotA/TolQ/ExbB proton channel family protein [Gammaproteobacteria bacterium]|nr:MotA/TolQ/ExbB proton channel family protein [Gammaproteobacteria bacterium]